MKGGQQIVLLEAKVRPDSIVGTEPKGRARIALPASQVKSIESEEFSAFRTTLLAGVAAGSFVVITLVMLITAGPNY